MSWWEWVAEGAAHLTAGVKERGRKKHGQVPVAPQSLTPRELTFSH